MRTIKSLLIIVGLAFALVVPFAQAQSTINKANNTTALNAGGSWTGGTAPTGVDTALWDATITNANSSVLGGSVTWGQIQLTNPGGAITIANTASATLTLNGVSGIGIDMSAATTNLTINNPITLGGAQSWTVGSGRTLTVGAYAVTNGGFQLIVDGDGTITLGGIYTGNGGITKAGSGTLILSGANTYTGGTTITDGTVKVGNAAALGTNSSAVSVASGAVLDMNGITMTRTNALTLIGSGIGGTGALINSTNRVAVYAGPITLAGDTTIGNINSAGIMRFTTLPLQTAGYTLTLKGSGQINFTLPATGIRGTGSVVVDGVYLSLITGGSQSVNDYTGTTTVTNGGTILHYVNNIGTGNIILNGGVLDGYANNGFTRGLGTGSNQVQIAGGASGFNTGTIDLSNVTEVQWGSSTFNPSTFILGTAGATIFAENIDLNNATRTITTTAGGILSGIISNSIGTAGLTKTGAGALTLSRTNNTFNGGVTVSAGMLTVTNLANGGANSSLGKSASDASNLLLADGTTLKYIGTGHSSDRSFTINGTAAGHSATLDASGSGALNLTSTATPGYGAANQTRTLTLGGTSTTTNTLAATLTDNGTGKLSVTKTGLGKWVLSGTNTYTGTTTVNAGLLGVGAANNLGSGGTLVLSGGGLSITGTTLTSLSGLGRMIVFTPGVPVTLDIADPANTFTVDQSLPTAGLVISGAGTVALQGSVSNLVLNVPTGVTATYGGVIADGATGMTVTKTGAGTQILQGANTYSGATYLNAGTLTLNGATGSLASSSIDLNSGNLTLDNSSTTGNLGTRLSDSATITLNGSSTLTFTHNAAAATDYSETIGTLSLQSGFLTYNGRQAVSGRTSGLSFNTLSRSGTATANFASTGLGTNAQNTIKFAAGVAADQDLGPWAVVNGADFAYYDATFGVKATASTTLALDSNDAAANFNLTGSSVTINASLNPTYKTLLISDATARTNAINGNTVSVGGISSSGQNHRISDSGAVQALNAGAPLYVNVNNNSLTMSSAIQDVGGTPSALVKSGSGTLKLAGLNTFTGGLVINAGSVGDSTDGVSAAELNNNSITVNGSGALIVTANQTLSSSSGLLINPGATLNIGSTGGSMTLNGVVSGSGVLDVDSNDINADSTTVLANPANTFSGDVIYSSLHGNTRWHALLVNSIGDSGRVVAGLPTSGNGNIQIFSLNSTATSDLIFNTRQFEHAGLNKTDSVLRIGNNSAQAFIINTDLLATGTGPRTLQLQGTGTGTNTFAGRIVDGAGMVVSLTKVDNNSTWILSGQNTYSGPTTVSAGTLVLAGSQCLSDTAALTIANSGTRKVKLDTGVQEKVGSLVFGTMTQVTGTWGSTASTADNKSDTYFSGEGLLYVGIDAPLPPPAGTVIIVK